MIPILINGFAASSDRETRVSLFDQTASTALVNRPGFCRGSIV
jgi:hypothetical protein